ncbi:MAG: gliding motility-associated C-terminal domain-containing protein, partial [Saprospiraceae bacterium]|nr:gliding motility-associated C-terminal domain-containing protein [Saprospiraceae bacterium]
GVFTGLDSGAYVVFVANALDTGCIQSWGSNPVELILEFAPSISSVDAINTTGCSLDNGSIEILFNAGSGLTEFSVDSGLTWSSSNIFENLVAGAYDLAVRNDNGQCESFYIGNPVTISDPGEPAIYNVVINQPASCSALDGAVLLQASGGTAPYEFSLDGVNWQLDSVFLFLPKGSYNPSVRDINLACVNEFGNVDLIPIVDNCPDTTSVIVPAGTVQNICLDTLVGVTAPFASAGECTAVPGPISVTVSPAIACVEISGPPTFYGSDTLCVYHCDGSLPTICDTTYIIAISPPPSDTLYLSIEQGDSLDLCLDNFFLQYDAGTLSSSVFLSEGSASEVLGTELIDNCLSLEANSSFEGQAGYVSVQHCYDNVPGLCDITVFSVTVSGNSCTAYYDGATIQQVLSTCSATPLWCSGLPMDTLADLNFYQNGMLVDPTAVACESDPENFALRIDIGENVFTIEHEASGCKDTVTVVLSSPVPTYMGPTTFEVECETQQLVCLPISYSNQASFIISTQTGNLFPVGCNSMVYFTYSFGGIPGAGLDGPYQVDSWMVNGEDYSGEFLDLQALVDSMNAWNPNGAWALNESSGHIFGGDTEDTYSNTISVTRINDSATGELTFDQVTSFENIGVNLNVGVHELEILHWPSGCTETVTLEVTCTPDPVCDTEILGEDISQELENCESQYSYCTNIPWSDWANYDLLVNGSSYTGVFDTCSTEMVQMVLDTGYYEISFNRLDIVCEGSVALEITCPAEGCKEVFFENAIYSYSADCSSQAETCFDFNVADKPEFSFELNGSPYAGPWLTCSDGNSGISLEAGDHILVAINSNNGCEDELTIRSRCNPAAQDTVLELAYNGSGTLCLDAGNLPGNIVDSWNSCPDESGEFSVVENLGDGCFSFSGVEEGLEQACLVQCDDIGNCDTLFVNVQVTGAPPQPLPVAADDAMMAFNDEESLINLLDNDQVNGLIESISVIDYSGPSVYWLEEDGSLHFVPQVDTCEIDLQETIQYELCNENGCDTAQVIIQIGCLTPETVSGFSPNGDGINDEFTIEDLDMFPNHQLIIYNRWGSQVLKVKDYQNDWRGTWNGADLPDGTYFWYLDTGEGHSKTGWVQIRR